MLIQVCIKHGTDTLFQIFLHKLKLHSKNTSKSINHHHHLKCSEFTFQKNFYLSYELEHDDGDDVVVIMYANDLSGGCGCVRSMDESKVRRVDRALCVDITDCLHNQDQTLLN